jgi:hypothetical protein
MALLLAAEDVIECDDEQGQGDAITSARAKTSENHGFTNSPKLRDFGYRFTKISNSN